MRARAAAGVLGGVGGPLRVGRSRATTPTRSPGSAAEARGAPARACSWRWSSNRGGLGDPPRAHDARAGRRPARAAAGDGHTPLPDLRHRVRAVRTLADLLDAHVPDAPTEELLDEEGVTHRLWEVSAIEPIDDVAARRGPPDRRRTPSLHDRACLPRRAARGGRSGTVGSRSLRSSSTRAPSRCPCCPTTVCRCRARPPRRGRPATRPRRRRWRGCRTQTLIVGTITRRDGRTLSLRRCSTSTARRPRCGRCMSSVLDAAAPGDALRFTHDARTPSERSSTGRSDRRLHPAADDAGSGARRDRARRSPAPEVDLLLAEAPHRHAVHARALTATSCACPPAAGSSRLIPVATTSVRLRAPAPLR